MRESVAADLLTRFLGDSVENLNKSQLKMGIWGGKREGAGPPTPRPARPSGDSHGLRRRRERARAA
jgi:hypothetical protein